MIDKVNVPSSWIYSTIASVVARDGIFTDGDWVESKDQDPYGDIRLIQLADIGDRKFLDKSSRFLTRAKAHDLNCTFLKKGDLLVARMPDPLGRCCIFPLDGLDKYVTVVDVCAIRLGTSVVDSKYLMHLINSPRTRADIEALKSGSTRKRISRKNFARIEIPLAPQNEQHRIATKIEELFSELDKGVESLKTAREQIKVYRQAVLKHAFEGKLTAKWREDNKDKLEKPEQLLARIKQERAARYEQQLQEWKVAVKTWEESGKSVRKSSKPKKPLEIADLPHDVIATLPELPNGWCWVRVGDCCQVVRGGSPRPAGDTRYYDGSIPFLKVADLTRTEGVYIDTYSFSIKEAGLHKTRLVEPPILMLSNSGATLGVPKVCRIKTTFNDGIAAFLGLEPGDLLYHCYFWTSKTLQLRAINQGAAQPNLNTDMIMETLMPLCTREEMKMVTKHIDRSLSMCDQLFSEVGSQLLRADALRQSILKRAFAGQLVAQDPHDEPASMLLARLRAATVLQESRAKV